MLKDYQELSKRLDVTHEQIIRIKHPRHRLDLNKMYVVANNALREVSKETVNCNRKGTATLKYKELMQAAEVCIESVEQNVMMALLMQS